MEDVAEDRAISVDSSSANQVDSDQMYLTTFGDGFPGPPVFPCSIDDALVDNSAAAPNSCLSPVKMRMLTTTCGLLPTGKASTALITIFDQLPLWFCLTKEMKFRTLK